MIVVNENVVNFDNLKGFWRNELLFFFVEINNVLESSEKEIEEKKSKIEEMLFEVEELRK